ncbi:hypothetical protein BH09ACT7_BH09ACT7_37020 [soil metagenome]
MADQEDQPDERPEAVAAAPEPTPAAEAPAAPVKKAPAKKAPAKAVKKAVKKAEPRKAPAKKAVKAEPSPPPAKAVPAPPPPPPAPPAPLAHTNGSGDITEGAKVVAAEAKSTVEQASDTVARPALAPAVNSGRSPVALAVAVAISLLAILVVRQLRRNSEDS